MQYNHMIMYSRNGDLDYKLRINVVDSSETSETCREFNTKLLKKKKSRNAVENCREMDVPTWKNHPSTCNEAESMATFESLLRKQNFPSSNMFSLQRGLSILV